jgi:nucleoside-diphosphate-sugar epimerase
MIKQIRSDFIFFGYGRITDNLIDYFLSRGKSVICVTNQATPSSEAPDLRFLSREELIKHKVVSDFAVFCWRDSGALNAPTNEWLSKNLIAIQKSFFLSSASVYMSSEKLLNEDLKNLSPDHLVNSKFLLERKLGEIFHAKDISHTNLRIANVYGRGLQHGFISSLLGSLNHKIPADVYNEKSITRDYVSVSDLSLAIERLTKIETKMQDLNISTGIGTDIEGVLQVFEDLGRKINLRNNKSAPNDIKSKVVLDCGLLQSLIQWDPIPLKVGISDILLQSTF